jgi:hypothetical protein
LAYHYLALGDKDSAMKELKETNRLQPNDKLSAELLKALSGNSGSNAPAPPMPGN